MMKHFFDRISAKSRELTEPPVLVVAFGDSITQGAMASGVVDPEGVYHYLVKRRLETFFPTATFNMMNSGIGGDWADRALERLDRDVIRYQPDLVLVAFGVNDACSGLAGLPTFEAALRKIVDEVQLKTQADILIVTPPFMASCENRQISPDIARFADAIIKTQSEGILAAYCQRLRAIGRELDIPVADVQAEWERLSQDGVPVNDWFTNGLNHPGRQGHQIAAEVIWHALLSSRPKTNAPTEVIGVN